MISSFDLTGRAAVVTGGSRGIGLAVATALVAHGAKVASWSRDLAANAAAIEPIGGIAVRCDVTDREDVARAMRESIEQLGRIDIVVACAGRPGDDVLFPDNDANDWDDIIAANLTSVFDTVHQFAKHAIDRGGGGKVIVISSIGAEFAMPRAVAYSAAKSGLVGFCRSTAVALARHNIQVNCVEPGWTETTMARPQLEDERIGAALRNRTPARRFASAEDMAGICVYLASAAADFHTGDVMRIDGGFVIA